MLSTRAVMMSGVRLIANAFANAGRTMRVLPRPAARRVSGARGASVAAVRLAVALLSFAQTSVGSAQDCDQNGESDLLTIRANPRADYNENGSLDRCEALEGDVDLNGRIEFADVAMAMLEFGPSEGSFADLDQDGVVHFSDLALIILQFGPSAHTSVPRLLLQELFDGSGHLDIVIVGDSNATFRDGMGARGYAGGFFDELSGRGVPLYGTGLFPVAQSGNEASYPRLGSLGGSQGPEASIYICDRSKPLDDWTRGSNVSHLMTSLFTPTSGDGLRLEGQVIDWAYLPAGGRTAGHGAEWITVPNAPSDSPNFDSETAGAFRVVVARFDADPNLARTPLEIKVTEIGNPEHPVISSLQVPTAHQGSTRIDAFETRFPAEPSRHTLSATFTASDEGSTGPIGMIYRSMYRTDGVPGFSVSVLQNWNGGTTPQIASSLDAISGCGTSTLQVFLREIADRQRAAGGSGRVLVFVNMGVNNASEAPANERLPLDTTSIIANLDHAWLNLGEDLDRLGYLVTASHEAGVPQYDPSLASQALWQSLAGNRRIAIVNLDAMAPASHLSDISGFAGNAKSPDAHLSMAGYRSVVERLLDRVMKGGGFEPN